MAVSINPSDKAAFVAAFGGLFEHSPWVAEETYERGVFNDAAAGIRSLSPAELHAELCATLRSASSERQRAVMDAHPDLAGRLARQGRLTAASTGEQASAGLNRLSEAEFAEFEQLNAHYRAKFGFPFIICARLNDKGAILNAMQARLGNSPAAEHEAALAEIEKIAWLRLQDVHKA